MSFFNTTLKRNSKLDLSKPDLLKLVSMLEGELQAREITIAVLKSEQIKRLLYPLQSLPSSKQQISGFKTTRQIDDCQLNSNQLSELTAEQTIKYSIDPLIALSRDSFAIYDPSLDYRTTLALYNIKTFQLENLINNQRRLHLKANDRIKTLENQYENLLNEYEKEKAKNNVNKNKNDSNDHDNDDRIEQDEKIKELTQQLNETKENMKQIVLSLLNERKQLILRLIDEKHQNDQLEQTLNMEKRKMAEMVEGLEDESKRSLQMEAELEKYMTDFEKERQEFRQKLETNEAKNKALVLENDRLRKLVEQLQAQLSDGSKISKTISSNNIDQEKWNLGEGVRSSIVTTMPVGPKVQSFSSVNPVFHPKASVAQPIPPITAANNLNKGTATAHSVTATAKSIQDVNSNTILPPPSIPVPQPKQQQQQQSNHCTIANSCTKNKSTTTIAADHVDEKNDDIDKSSKQQIDTSVKQTVMFYENSVKTATKATTTTAATVIAAPVTTTVSSTTASTLSSVSTTGTMVKKPSSGQRPIPPPIPPNKPTIRPVLPHQALLSFTKSNINNNINNNNTKDSNAITNHSNNNNNNNNKITNPSKTTTTINKVNTNNTNKSPTITNNSANNAQQQQQKQGTTTTLSLLKKFSFDGKS